MDDVRERGISVVVGRVPLIEIAGYVGASLGLAAAGVVLGESAGEGVQIAFDLVTAAVLVAAGWALEPDADAYRRMRSVLWCFS
ncbi:MAG TPA: hypothetical protein VGS09_00710 [Actinomycetota bacterium]|jgi:hypothetical protein|nr:hypothetical protein [Actinomycetota bacterium]